MPYEVVGSAEDTEQQFYEAMQQGDIEKLMAVWSDDDEIVCVHPGASRVVGPVAIRAAYAGIFANGAIDVRPERRRCLQMHGAAVHSVVEHVQVGRQSAWVIATNVYVKTAQGWRLVAHHASPGSPSDLQEIVETASSVLH
ncbi:MAG: nuclear transport factor 2 family protein [Burkholderiaceae bacterium]|nr:nuclear transport factor 2 family protein [Burkholderiaceae bacterium]MDH3461323.1 nuclear transport factor 2 family protein [Burkholderiaceae bacterium]